MAERYKRAKPAGGGGLGKVVVAARAGDRAALDELVRATYRETYTLAYRLTGNEHDAGDVTQDAYLRVHKGLTRFRGDAEFTTWLYRITANCASTLLSKKRRQRTEQLDHDAAIRDADDACDPEFQAAASDERTQVVLALRGLPLTLRQALVLRDVYDLPHRAIAQELGISEAAAKVRLHRARTRIRAILLDARDGSNAEGAEQIRDSAGGTVA